MAKTARILATTKRTAPPPNRASAGGRRSKRFRRHKKNTRKAKKKGERRLHRTSYREKFLKGIETVGDRTSYDLDDIKALAKNAKMLALQRK